MDESSTNDRNSFISNGHHGGVDQGNYDVDDDNNGVFLLMMKIRVGI